MIDPTHKWNVSFKPIIWGFVLSIVLTLAAYFIVVEHALAGWVLILTIVALGCLQALIQFICFLHLGIETKPHWNMIIFLFMILVVVVLVSGSLWIMRNLDYNVMLPEAAPYGWDKGK